MKNMDADLSLIATADMVRELMKRHDVVIMAMIKKLQDDRYMFETEYKGPSLECIGLATAVKDDVTHHCLAIMRGQMEDAENDDI